MLPDEQAVEILRLIDGNRDVDTVIDELAGLYDAPRDVIAGDVLPMLQDLVDKKVLRQ
jgi:pyrroloquinoline quinone biosynthesis protein D